jgi:hypothetical protein
MLCTRAKRNLRPMPYAAPRLHEAGRPVLTGADSVTSTPGGWRG